MRKNALHSTVSQVTDALSNKDDLNQSTDGGGEGMDSVIPTTSHSESQRLIKPLSWNG